MIDLQAMTGDSTDNVPGIPGIGPKTAAQLLEEFGDLDTLLARAGEIKQQKRRENIIANAELARLSRQLVTLKTDTPIDVPLEDFELHTAGRAEADRLPEGDGIHHADAPRRRGDCDAMPRRSRRQTCRSNGVRQPMVPISTRAKLSPPPPPSALSSADRALPAAPPRLPPSLLASADGAAAATPQNLAQARAQVSPPRKIDHSTYVTIRDVATLDAWIADGARDRASSPSTPRRPRSTRCRPNSSASRWRSPTTARTRRAPTFAPPTCRSVHKNGVGDLLGGGLADEPDPAARCPRPAEGPARRRLRPEGRAEPEIRLPA